METACPTYVDLYRKVVVSGVFLRELKMAVHLSGLARGIAMAAHETLHLKNIYVTHLSSPCHTVQNLRNYWIFYFILTCFALNKLT